MASGALTFYLQQRGRHIDYTKYLSFYSLRRRSARDLTELLDRDTARALRQIVIHFIHVKKTQVSRIIGVSKLKAAGRRPPDDESPLELLRPDEESSDGLPNEELLSDELP